MAETADAPAWLLPLVIAGFPVVFAILWTVICGVLARVSGYPSLRRFVVDRQRLKRVRAVHRPGYAMIGAVSYSGVLSLYLDETGLGISVFPVFPFHPPVQVPWSRVRVSAEAGDGWFAMGSVLLDERVTLKLPRRAMDAVRAAAPRH